MRIHALVHVFLVALLPAYVVRGDCSNHYGDEGQCVSPLECEVTQGVRIGGVGSCVSAGDRDRSRVCCKHLPCSGTGILANNIEDFIRFTLRRFPRHAAPSLPSRHPLARSPAAAAETADCRRLERDLIELGARDPNIKCHGHTCDNPTQKRYPWLLSLWKRVHPNEVDGADEDNSFAICGAALISSGHAMTAAHCVVHGGVGDAASLYFVRGGTNNNVVGRGVVIPVTAIHVHDSFDPRSFENDIAVLALGNVPLSVTPPHPIYPVCLPPVVARADPVSDYTGETVLVAGWGCVDEENCDIPAVLRDTVMPIVDNDMASCWFMNDSKQAGTAEYIPERVFVVGGDESGSRTTCKGDSGSPVVRSNDHGHWEVIGIVSWSRGCGRRFRPSVWTRVESFVPWVKGKMREDGVGQQSISPAFFFR